jgi:chromosome segregation ATPase
MNVEEELMAQIAALAARHEKALVEGAARLAERDEARAQIAAIEATDRRLIEENGRLQAQIAAKDAEIARLRKALLTCATIPHMGQYTGSQVNAAIEESKPWE